MWLALWTISMSLALNYNFLLLRTNLPTKFNDLEADRNENPSFVISDFYTMLPLSHCSQIGDNISSKHKLYQLDSIEF